MAVPRVHEEPYFHPSMYRRKEAQTFREFSALATFSCGGGPEDVHDPPTGQTRTGDRTHFSGRPLQYISSERYSSSPRLSRGAPSVPGNTSLRWQVSAVGVRCENLCSQLDRGERHVPSVHAAVCQSGMRQNRPSVYSGDGNDENVPHQDRASFRSGGVDSHTVENAVTMYGQSQHHPCTARLHPPSVSAVKDRHVTMPQVAQGNACQRFRTSPARRTSDSAADSVYSLEAVCASPVVFSSSVSTRSSCQVSGEPPGVVSRKTSSSGGRLSDVSSFRSQVHTDASRQVAGALVHQCGPGAALSHSSQVSSTSQTSTSLTPVPSFRAEGAQAREQGHTSLERLGRDLHPGPASTLSSGLRSPTRLSATLGKVERGFHASELSATSSERPATPGSLRPCYSRRSHDEDDSTHGECGIASVSGGGVSSPSTPRGDGTGISNLHFSPHSYLGAHIGDSAQCRVSPRTALPSSFPGSLRTLKLSPSPTEAASRPSVLRVQPMPMGVTAAVLSVFPFLVPVSSLLNNRGNQVVNEIASSPVPPGSKYSGPLSSPCNAAFSQNSAGDAQRDLGVQRDRHSGLGKQAGARYLPTDSNARSGSLEYTDAADKPPHEVGLRTFKQGMVSEVGRNDVHMASPSASSSLGGASCASGESSWRAGEPEAALESERASEKGTAAKMLSESFATLASRIGIHNFSELLESGMNLDETLLCSSASPGLQSGRTKPTTPCTARERGLRGLSSAVSLSALKAGACCSMPCMSSSVEALALSRVYEDEAFCLLHHDILDVKFHWWSALQREFQKQVHFEEQLVRVTPRSSANRKPPKPSEGRLLDRWSFCVSRVTGYFVDKARGVLQDGFFVSSPPETEDQVVKTRQSSSLYFGAQAGLSFFVSPGLAEAEMERSGGDPVCMGAEERMTGRRGGSPCLSVSISGPGSSSFGDSSGTHQGILTGVKDDGLVERGWDGEVGRVSGQFTSDTRLAKEAQSLHFHQPEGDVERGRPACTERKGRTGKGEKESCCIPSDYRQSTRKRMSCAESHEDENHGTTVSNWGPAEAGVRADRSLDHGCHPTTGQNSEFPHVSVKKRSRIWTWMWETAGVLKFCLPSRFLALRLLDSYLAHERCPVNPAQPEQLAMVAVASLLLAGGIRGHWKDVEKDSFLSILLQELQLSCSFDDIIQTQCDMIQLLPPSVLLGKTAVDFYRLFLAHLKSLPHFLQHLELPCLAARCQWGFHGKSSSRQVGRNSAFDSAGDEPQTPSSPVRAEGRESRFSPETSAGEDSRSPLKQANEHMVTLFDFWKHSGLLGCLEALLLRSCSAFASARDLNASVPASRLVAVLFLRLLAPYSAFFLQGKIDQRVVRLKQSSELSPVAGSAKASHRSHDFRENRTHSCVQSTSSSDAVSWSAHCVLTGSQGPTQMSKLVDSHLGARKGRTPICRNASIGISRSGFLDLSSSLARGGPEPVLGFPEVATWSRCICSLLFRLSYDGDIVFWKHLLAPVVDDLLLGLPDNNHFLRLWENGVEVWGQFIERAALAGAGERTTEPLVCASSCSSARVGAETSYQAASWDDGPLTSKETSGIPQEEAPHPEQSSASASPRVGFERNTDFCPSPFSGSSLDRPNTCNRKNWKFHEASGKPPRHEDEAPMVDCRGVTGISFHEGKGGAVQQPEPTLSAPGRERASMSTGNSRRVSGGAGADLTQQAGDCDSSLSALQAAGRSVPLISNGSASTALAGGDGKGHEHEGKEETVRFSHLAASGIPRLRVSTNQASVRPPSPRMAEKIERKAEFVRIEAEKFCKSYAFLRTTVGSAASLSGARDPLSGPRKLEGQRHGAERRGEKDCRRAAEESTLVPEERKGDKGLPLLLPDACRTESICRQPRKTSDKTESMSQALGCFGNPSRCKQTRGKERARDQREPRSGVREDTSGGRSGGVAASPNSPRASLDNHLQKDILGAPGFVADTWKVLEEIPIVKRERECRKPCGTVGTVEDSIQRLPYGEDRTVRRSDDSGTRGQQLSHPWPQSNLEDPDGGQAKTNSTGAGDSCAVALRNQFSATAVSDITGGHSTFAHTEFQETRKCCRRRHRGVQGDGPKEGTGERISDTHQQEGSTTISPSANRTLLDGRREGVMSNGYNYGVRGSPAERKEHKTLSGDASLVQLEGKGISLGNSLQRNRDLRNPCAVAAVPQATEMRHALRGGSYQHQRGSCSSVKRGAKWETVPEGETACSKETASGYAASTELQQYLHRHRRSCGVSVPPPGDAEGKISLIQAGEERSCSVQTAETDATSCSARPHRRGCPSGLGEGRHIATSMGGTENLGCDAGMPDIPRVDTQALGLSRRDARWHFPSANNLQDPQTEASVPRKEADSDVGHQTMPKWTQDSPRFPEQPRRSDDGRVLSSVIDTGGSRALLSYAVNGVGGARLENRTRLSARPDQSEEDHSLAFPSKGAVGTTAGVKAKTHKRYSEPPTPSERSAIARKHSSCRRKQRHLNRDCGSRTSSPILEGENFDAQQQTLVGYEPECTTASPGSDLSSVVPYLGIPGKTLRAPRAKGLGATICPGLGQPKHPVLRQRVSDPADDGKQFGVDAVGHGGSASVSVPAQQPSEVNVSSGNSTQCHCRGLQNPTVEAAVLARSQCMEDGHFSRVRVKDVSAKTQLPATSRFVIASTESDVQQHASAREDQRRERKPSASAGFASYESRGRAKCCEHPQRSSWQHNSKMFSSRLSGGEKDVRPQAETTGGESHENTSNITAQPYDNTRGSPQPLFNQRCQPLEESAAVASGASQSGQDRASHRQLSGCMLVGIPVHTARCRTRTERDVDCHRQGGRASGEGSLGGPPLCQADGVADLHQEKQTAIERRDEVLSPCFRTAGFTSNPPPRVSLGENPVTPSHTPSKRYKNFERRRRGAKAETETDPPTSLGQSDGAYIRSESHSIAPNCTLRSENGPGSHPNDICTGRVTSSKRERSGSNTQACRHEVEGPEDSEQGSSLWGPPRGLKPEAWESPYPCLQTNSCKRTAGESRTHPR
ncbi:amine-terminal domain cyclin [Cystoisospora suis]|uniref:Amine-terminal domain cyclin n=1 Tax=Cystoisospora suis TaxID=483139 RepID=A0A2C6KSH5_9APIC|nr:amine-terminal domain cyclin [Cystoisospora suis]